MKQDHTMLEDVWKEITAARAPPSAPALHSATQSATDHSSPPSIGSQLSCRSGISSNRMFAAAVPVIAPVLLPIYLSIAVV
jgi:hypothetical protein